MFSYKFIVRAEKNNALRLRLTNNRKAAEISLGIQLPQEDLDDALSPKPKPRNARWRSMLLNFQYRLDNIKQGLLAAGRAGEDVSAIRGLVIKEIFNQGCDEPEPETKRGEFAEWFMRFADTHPGAATRTRQGYLHTLSRLRDFDKELDKRDFCDITVAWLDRLDAFWSKTMSVNSRNHHMRNIRAVFKYAIRNDLDIRNPFDRMRLKTEETLKRCLPVGSLRKIFDYPVEPYAEIYRDVFKLAFMLIGINPVDLFRLKGVSAEGRVEYRRAKTHKIYSVKVEPEAMEIIERHKGVKGLLSLADRWKSHEAFGKAANRALRNIGAPKPAPGRKRNGKGLFPGLTLYVARHSWATIAADLDVPDAVISQALGHSSANKVTEIYIKRNRRKVDEANRRVLDWVLYGKR